MIIYNKEFDLSLDKFGIEVPILDDRSSRCFFELQKLVPNLKEVELSSLKEITKEDLLRVHTRELVDRLFTRDRAQAIIDCYELIDDAGEYHRYDPNKSELELGNLVDKFILQTKGTYATLEGAFSNGFAFGLCGGMHHGMSDRSRGFCLINDIIICARKFQSLEKNLKFSIIDIDAHKGCGSAELTHNDPSIETLSIHMKDGWPLSEECGDGPWRIPSTIDIGISAGEENSYLEKLQEGLEQLKNLEIAIVVAGADPYDGDVLESARGIQLSKEQMLERDLLVYEFLKSRNIPQAWVMAGGYGPKTWEIYYQFLKSIREEELS
ncbi:putative histone deacetylase [Halobacteriovorax marinus SJ]|uniref:Histone deacetylase n=1 Tax=Halobacteriovorax marinus (strain ATCC BAA-682 / DSM 15412 / SJ) TaxID=862908 RepID=E1WXX1_HALMS|nr:histone deacetylase [Halobacteriovorax marinus]CBW25928.1 putative histone deacetylase [Halobacteriovorax marinus SJ]